MRLGKNLEKLRKQHNWKQKEVAAKLGVESSRYCRWETGAIVPGVDIIIDCAQLYGVSLDDLCGYKLTSGKQLSNVEVALARLSQMRISSVTESDNVHLDIYGTIYTVPLKDLPDLINKTDRCYESLLRDIQTGLYNSAIALAMNKGLHKDNNSKNVVYKQERNGSIGYDVQELPKNLVAEETEKFGMKE